MTEIEARLQAVFDRTFVDPVKISPELGPDKVEEWDSVTQISLVLAMEKEFGVRFRLGEAHACKSVGEFITLIQKALKEK